MHADGEKNQSQSELKITDVRGMTFHCITQSELVRWINVHLFFYINIYVISSQREDNYIHIVPVRTKHERKQHT